MKSDLTKHTLLQTVVLFFALASVFLFSGTIMPRQTVTLTGYTPLMVSIVTFVDTIPWLAMGLSLLLITINAFFLTRITVRFLSFSDKNYTASLIYLILCTVTSSLTGGFVVQSIVFLTLVSIETIFMFNKRDDIVRQMFLSSAYIGITSILFIPSAVVFAAMITHLIIYRTINLKGLLAALTGLALPLFLYCYVTWVAGGAFTAPLECIRTIFDEIFLRRSLNIFEMTVLQYIFIALVVGISIYGFIRMAMSVNHANTLTVRSYVYFVCLLAVLALTLALAYNTLDTPLPMIAVPLSVIISMLFRQAPNLYVKNAIALAFLVLALML